MNVRKGGRLHRASGNVCIGGIIDSRSWIQAFGGVARSGIADAKNRVFSF
jgi:hypothetical protein